MLIKVIKSEKKSNIAEKNQLSIVKYSINFFGVYLNTYSRNNKVKELDY